MGRRRRALLAALAAGCLLGGCGSGSGSAPEGPKQRAIAQAFNGFIGAAPSGEGGRFTEPSDLAVYSGNNERADDDKIFVVEADAGRNARVQRLDRHGNFELAWGADVVREGAAEDSGTGPEICREASSCKTAPPSSADGGFRMPTAVAVDDATGAVYVMDTGNRRVQQFTLSGRFVRAWGQGMFGRSASNGIAVRPGQGDVFATDASDKRVLQFDADGRFIRAWAWTGDPRWVESGSWPRHVAVGRDGLVYASDSSESWRILRFDSSRTGGETSDPGALLPPLEMESHTSLGLDVDSVGDLVSARDRQGPAVVDVIANPEAPRTRGTLRTGSTMAFDGYVASINGLAVNPTTGIIYLAKGEHLYVNDPGTGLAACSAAGGTRECHGLMVVGPRTQPRASLDRPRSVGDGSAELSGSVTAAGAITYRFQLSRDGGRWINVDPARYLTGVEKERVRSTVSDLDSGVPYRARILLERLSLITSEGEPFVSPVRNLR